MARWKFYSGPNHGWLKVPKADIPDALPVSTFSYQSAEHVFLEEDCDAPRFMDWMRQSNPFLEWGPPYVELVQIESEAAIRSLPRFESKVKRFYVEVRGYDRLNRMGYGPELLPIFESDDEDEIVQYLEGFGHGDGGG